MKAKYLTVESDTSEWGNLIYRHCGNSVWKLNIKDSTEKAWSVAVTHSCPITYNTLSQILSSA